MVMLSPTPRLGAAVLATALAVQLLSPPTVLAPAQRGRKDKGSAPAAELTPFLGSLAEARKASTEQNVPLLIHLILEGEEHNDQYREQLLPNKALIALSQHAVVIIANNGEHEPKTIKQDLEGRVVERQVCSSYPWFSRCADHRAPWDPLYGELADEDGGMRCPQTVIELPGGEQSWRFNTANPPEAKQLIAELQKAQKKAGPGLSSEELRQVKSLAKEGRRAMDGRLWGDAWRSWSALLQIIEVGKYGEEAATSLKQTEEAMAAELAAQVERLVPGTAADAYEAIVLLTKEWIGSEMEGRARAAQKRAETDKAIEQEVEAKKLELEAEEVWQEGQELLRSGEEKAAHKLFKKLLRKKYADTPAARRVREEFPELG